MFDAGDASFAQQLEQRILRVLSGDADSTGLYRSVLASQDWAQFKLTTGEIKGYESVLNMMVEIARAMNDGDSAKRRETDRRLS